jgi:TonB-dependent Receptor Plug Domain
MLYAGEKNISGRDSVDLLKKLPEALHSAMNNSDQGDTGIILSGIIKDREGFPREGQVITFIEDGNNFILSDTTDAGGLFSFPPFNFTDQTPFFTQVTDLNKVKQNVVVYTDRFPFKLPATAEPEINRWVAFPQGLNTFRQAAADSLLTGTVKNALEIVVNREVNSVKKGKTNVAERNSASVVISGEELDKLGQGNTYNAIILLQGVQIRKGKLTIRDATQSNNPASGDVEPLLIEDGVPVVSSSVSLYLNSIPPQNIEYINIIKGIEALRYGNRATNGVILIKTANIQRKQNAADQVGIQYIFPVGYQKKQLFYMPPYEYSTVRDASFTDNRATIYWNGEIISDPEGKASFQFYTADTPSIYTIHIRGVSSKGDFIDETLKLKRN